MYESEMYPQIEEFLRKKGFHFYKEVKFLTRSIDLVAIKKNKVVAIEVKVNNWKRALQQALACRLCAHEVYIAIWYKYTHRVPLDLLKQYHIGLLNVKDDTVKIKQKPKKSAILHETIMNDILSKL